MPPFVFEVGDSSFALSLDENFDAEMAAGVYEAMKKELLLINPCTTAPKFLQLGYRMLAVEYTLVTPAEFIFEKAVPTAITTAWKCWTNGEEPESVEDLVECIHAPTKMLDTAFVLLTTNPE